MEKYFEIPPCAKPFLENLFYFIERGIFASNCKFNNKNDLLCEWLKWLKKIWHHLCMIPNVYKFFFSETSCDFNECIQGCQYVKIGLNQGCSEACDKNQTFQKNTTCVDLCKKTSQQFMTSIIGRDLFLLAFLGFMSWNWRWILNL